MQSIEMYHRQLGNVTPVHIPLLTYPFNKTLLIPLVPEVYVNYAKPQVLFFEEERCNNVSRGMQLLLTANTQTINVSLKMEVGE